MQDKVSKIIDYINKNKINSDTIKYVVDNFNIDESIELLENCNELLNILNKININELNNSLYFAYQIVTNQENEIESYDDLLNYIDNMDKKYKNIDIIKLYLLETRKYPILSHEETIELFKKYHSCNNENEKDLIRNEIINHNLRLVISIAKKQFTKYSGTSISMPFLDLIQEGNLGLYSVIDKFDYTRGYRFSSYATYSIKQSIRRSMCDKGRTIRLSVSLIEKYYKYLKIREIMINSLGYVPSDEQVAEKMNISFKKLLSIKLNCESIISLDAPVTSDMDGDYTLADIIPYNDEEIENLPDKMYLQEIRNTYIYNSGLSEKEIVVITLRYGLNDGKYRSLEEIGQELHITREGVRQLEFNALKKIRKNIEFRSLIFEREKENRLNLYK